MSTRFQKNNNHAIAQRGFNWVKLVGITGFSQAIVQAIGFVCGILIIRLLPTQEYALYTLANTMFGTMIVLSDAGISSGVMAEGAHVWKDKDKLGQVIATGFNLRKKFAVISLLVSIPILLYLLYQNGASILMSIIIALALIPAFISSLSANLLETPVKLQQDIVPLQKNQLAVNFGRLLLLGLTIFVFPLAFVALLATGASQVWGNFRLRKIISPYVELKQPVSKTVHKNISKIITRTLPGAIYYCISGQLTVWILAVFGTTSNLAEIGALGRIAVLLSLITVVFKTLVVPRFSRLQNEFKLLFSRFAISQLLLLIVALVVTGLVYLFGSQILLVLGSKYEGLEYELVLVMIGGCLNLISALTFSICVSKGWVINPLITIPINILTIIAGVLLLNVTTLQGVLIFNIVIALVGVIMNSIYGFYKIMTLKNT